MTQPARKPAPQLDESDLLVVGYQGALRPRVESSQGAPGQRLTHHPPPALEAFLATATNQAAHDLARRTSPALLVFRDEPIPLNGMLLILKDRLLALLIQAFDQEDSQQPTHPHWDHFPVLTHLLRHTVAEWISATVVFLERFSGDHESLAHAHGLGRLPPVQSVSGCASDVHAGGHSVLRITFANAGPTLFYKPRSLTGEWLWHGLLKTIAQYDPGLRLPAARIHTPQGRFHYGWMDSLEASEQTGRGAEIHGQDPTGPWAGDYWHRAGAMLCLAQHMCLTDLHVANILATPSGPAVVDAECLATPRFAPTQPSSGRAQTALFSDALNSILATGLVPGAPAPGQPDVSGFFGRAAPVEAIKLPQWSIPEDGRYRLAPCSASLADHHNAPAQTSPAAVLPQLISGYRHAAEVLQSARGSLLGSGSHWLGILQETHTTRIVLRDTLTYAHWISRSLLPRHLRSHAGRRATVSATISAASSQPLSGACLRAETRAILQAHVPRLILAPGTRTLASSSGRPIVHSFASHTAAQSVEEQLVRLSPDHIDNVLVPALLAACLAP